MRKPTFCICENKDADQLRGNREADQRLCFRYLDSTIPLLPKSKISSLWPSSVDVQPGLCQTWSKSKLLVFLRRGSFIYRNCKETVASYLAILSSVPYTIVGRVCYDSKWLYVAKPYFRHQMDIHFLRTLTESVDPHCQKTEFKLLNCVTFLQTCGLTIFLLLGTQ